MANSVPPTLRTRLLAPEIMFDISSGACCSRTSVMASAMLDATGSASWIQTGMVASIHSVRVSRRGVAVSSEIRSEEHTSELQSRPHLVCRLLLEKKKKQNPSYGQQIADR